MKGRRSCPRAPQVSGNGLHELGIRQGRQRLDKHWHRGPFVEPRPAKELGAVDESTEVFGASHAR
jgi:hypothetical protein